MRQVLILSCLLIAVFDPPPTHAAACPNLSVHPGITTLFLQTDFGEKDTATKIFATGMEDAIKKSRQFCLVQDLRAATFALDLAGVDITEDHERAAVSVVLISEKGSLLSHWVRVSSIDNTEKNCREDLVKVDRAIQRSKQHR
jgi:hypothetical protein